MPVTCKVKNCDNRAVLKRPKTGDPMCKECFFYSFETEIHFTIMKGELFKKGNRVAIGASGGKDSTVLAYIMKLLNERYDYGLDLFLLSIDEGITGYRDDSLETVKQNRDDYQLPLKILSYKDLYGWTMDEIVAQIGKTNNCTFCGVFRRQALDRGAALVGADIIATGHNADDVAETIIMNLMRGDLARLSRCTNIITEGEGSIPRCKPLKYAYEKEIVMYAHFKELVYFSTECIYAPNAYRGYTREYIKEVERIRPSCILDIIHSGETLRVNDTVKFPARRTCTRCGFVASQEICKACVLLEGLNRGIPKLGVGKSNKAKKLLGIHVPDGSENKSKKPPREGKSKKKIKRELQREKQMKITFKKDNSFEIKEESTCAEDYSEESNKLTGEEYSSETKKKSTCGKACTSSCTSKASEPTAPKVGEPLTPEMDFEFDSEKILTFIENSIGIKDESDCKENYSTECKEKSTCKGDCLKKNNEKSISEEDRPSGSNKKSISEEELSRSIKKSTCGKACTSSYTSEASEPTGPKVGEPLTPETDFEFDSEKILTYLENILGIKDGSDSEEENYSSESNEKLLCKGDCFPENNEKSIAKEDRPSRSNKKSISENRLSRSNKKSTCGESCTLSCSFKVSASSIPKKDKLLLTPETNIDDDEVGCGAFDTSVPLMSMEDYSSCSEDEVPDIAVKEKEEKVTYRCPPGLRADSPPDSFTLDLDNSDDEGFDIVSFLDLITNHTKEELQDARIRQVFGFNSDDDLEKFFSCDLEKEPKVESTETNETEKLLSTEKAFKNLQLNSNSQSNKSDDSQPCSSRVNKSEKTESQSSLSTLNEPERAESDEQPTVIKAAAKKKGPSLILPHMMHKAKNNLDF